ncbi:response regulator [Massilia sp. TS11]|uniref:response regulator n=1 Tax=Massilia sp. TS11 TaxID=2908003 RepID=UPI001EDA3777|nr:response regulator [Massilia sp. TS11]MCG2584287.1 response regulator [Massilia sp. TS11]
MRGLLRQLAQHWRRNILFRLAAGIVMAVGLTTGVYTSYVMYSLRQEAGQTLQERVERQAQVLSHALARPLFDINSAAVSSVVDALGATPEVLMLRVLSPNGTVIASLGSIERDPGNAILVNRPISYTDGARTYPVGSLELAFSRHQIDLDLQRQILHTAAANLMLTLAIVACIFLVARRATKPFADIQSALEKLAHGETDIELSGLNRKDQIGRLSLAVRSFRDTLTRLRQAEQVTKGLLDEKSRMVDRLNAIFEGTNDALMLLTEEGFFDCNHHTLEMFGLPNKEAFVKCHPSTLSPPLQADGRDSFVASNERIHQAMQLGQARFEWIHRRADGSDFPAEVLLSAFDYGGRQVLQATVRDITQRKQIEQQLRELNEDLEQRISERTQELVSSIKIAQDSQKKLQTIVDTALDAVVRMDLKGRIVGWNTQAEQIFGWTREEVLGQSLGETIVPPRFREAHAAGMKRYMESGSGAVLNKRIEIYALRRDGTEFPIELAITRVRMDNEAEYEFCSFIRDISERREREQSLVAANVRAEAANVAKSEFLANMSHEIRTPMSAIIGMAYLALRTELTPKQQDYVGKIHRAALSLLGIINDILDFSKIEAGKLEVESIPFFLDDVLSNVASVTSQKAADKQLEYLFHVPHTIPRHLVGDPLRLGQVLINLVNNAVKFTEKGELELSIARLPDHSAGKVVLRFLVRDTGIGMTEEQMGKLFRAFSQANATTTREYGGTGLGLSISQQLVQLMGGKIEVASRPGEGSSFHFDLEFPLSGLPERVTVMPAALNEARVLLVDDSTIALDILVEALQALPLRVDTAISGPDALAMIRAADIKRDPYKLVLTDWQMPGMDGIELARAVCADDGLGARPAMVLVTAFGREEVQREAEAAGITGFLFKPIGQSVLTDTLVSLFAPARRASSGPDEAAPRQFAVKVLLVEDNEVNQQIATELMAVQGISVDVANNGRQALDKLRAAGPDGYGLVLMDLEMPQMDGHEATLALRRDPQFNHVPIIAMTAHALAEIRERCLREGMQDYITKPIDPEKLYTTLARWLGHAMPARVPLPARETVALPSIAGIDTSMGLRHVAGNTVLYIQLLDRFRDSQRTMGGEILDLMSKGLRLEAGKRAHTLRGLAGNIGAKALQQSAQLLDEQVRATSPDHEALLQQARALERELVAVVAGLDRYFDTTTAGAITAAAAEDSTADVGEALARLNALLEEFSGEATDYFDSVRKLLAGQMSTSALDRLSGHLSRYEFEEARRLLATEVRAPAA